MRWKHLLLCVISLATIHYSAAQSPKGRSHQRPEAEGKANLERMIAATPDKASWETRRELLRSEIPAAIGIDKVLEPYSGKVILSEKRVYGDYYVQNLGMEILPGLYISATIYHPVKFKASACPVVINPHGHFDAGRCEDDVQIRCAMQAKLGCIAIAYDMFASGIEPVFDRSFHKSRYAQPIQVLSAIRLMDWALNLPEADHTRVGITGASGGGSQSMFVSAIDDRVTLSMPVVMISSHFDGGCACESGTDIHLCGGGTNNVEIAALFAPKPMIFVSDGDDWTKNTPEVEYPYIKRIYSYYGAESSVMNVHLPNEGHDYGYSKRQAVYAFMVKQWKLKPGRIWKSSGVYDETRCVIEDAELLRVWGKEGEKLPSDAIREPELIDRLLGWE